ncbi:MAG TPA: hypothetical protein DCQ06_05165 [Myxococcales bacterium]|nr:hypothetical protein [Myxococcales bacterium]
MNDTQRALALPLQAGDPLPELRLEPALDINAYQGAWLALVSCDDAAEALSLHEALVVAGVKIALCALVRGPLGRTQSDPLVLTYDRDGHSADALGALDAGQGRVDLVTLIDPRSTVQAAFVHQDREVTLSKIVDCVGVSPRR